MKKLNNSYVEPVVLAVRADEPDKYRANPVNYQDNQPVLIAPNIENHPVVSHYRGIGINGFQLVRRSPVGLLHGRYPLGQASAGVWVGIEELP